MPPEAFALALASAALHAGWNAVTADSDDPQATTAAALLTAVALFAIPAALTWRVGSGVWPYLLASTACHTTYFLCLTAAYRRADLSVVYPVARGVAPPLVLIGSVLFTAAGAHALQVAGVGAVAAGALLVRGPAHDDARGLLLALATGVAIAGYTVLDKQGLGHAAPLPYLELLVLVPVTVQVALLGRGGRLRSHLGKRAAAQGTAMLGSYALALAALTLAPAASVAAVRESSVLMAVLIGAFVLKEQVSRGRWGGAALVALGLAAVSLG